MSIERQVARARVPEGEPINTVFRLAVAGRPLGSSEITNWDLKVFCLTARNPRRPIYKVLAQSPTGVFYDTLQVADGLLPDGYNFRHTLDEASFPSGHAGGAKYRLEYTIRTTNPLASVKVFRSDVSIVSTYSS